MNADVKTARCHSESYDMLFVRLVGVNFGGGDDISCPQPTVLEIGNS